MEILLYDATSQAFLAKNCLFSKIDPFPDSRHHLSLVTDNYLQRFGGIARLYGMTALQKFHDAHIMVVGIGGVGSWAVEALARTGIGKISMVDLDELCITNINRQLHAMDGQIGKQKTSAMEERIRAINPEAQIMIHETFYSEKNADELLSDSLDGLIDAIDAVKAKTHLLATCRTKNIPVVTSGGAGGRQDPTQIQTIDLSRTYNDALLNQVRKNLRSQHGFPKGEVKSSKPSKKFYIPAVFSPESPKFPQCDGSVSPERPEGTNLRLSCDSGYGTATHLTATFGLMTAHLILDKLLE